MTFTQDNLTCPLDQSYFRALMNCSLNELHEETKRLYSELETDDPVYAEKVFNDVMILHMVHENKGFNFDTYEVQHG